MSVEDAVERVDPDIRPGDLCTYNVPDFTETQSSYICLNVCSYKMMWSEDTFLRASFLRDDGVVVTLSRLPLEFICLLRRLA